MLIKALRGLEDYVHLCPISSGVAGCVLLIFAYFAPIFPGKSRPSAPNYLSRFAYSLM